MRFVLLVEGRTEKLGLPYFLQRWLHSQLTSTVSVKTRLVLTRDFPAEAKRQLGGPTRNDIIAVVGLLDLYALQVKYPKTCNSVAEKVAWATRHFESRVKDGRFRMFFAVHEVEAWLLSDPEVFPAKVQEGIGKYAIRPEAVNFENPPAKLLAKHYLDKLGRGYKKTVRGSDAFRKLNAERARERCPYLRHMLDTMLQLAKDAGL